MFITDQLLRSQGSIQNRLPPVAYTKVNQEKRNILHNDQHSLVVRGMESEIILSKAIDVWAGSCVFFVIVIVYYLLLFIICYCYCLLFFIVYFFNFFSSDSSSLRHAIIQRRCPLFQILILLQIYIQWKVKSFLFDWQWDNSTLSLIYVDL